MHPTTNRNRSDNNFLSSYLSTIEPKVLVRIIIIFLIVDFFALQKHLSSITTYILIIVPLVLFAVTNYLWFLQKKLPILHPYFGYTGLFDKEHKANWALVAFFMTIGLIILISYLFPSLYETVAQTRQ